MTSVRDPGGVLLLSTYELGHQPLAIASPAAFLRRAGFRPRLVDTAIDELPDAAIDAASLVAISAPMLTALRLGVGLAGRIRARNPSAHICLYGLYAGLNAAHLLERHVDSIVVGEFEEALVSLAEALDRGHAPAPPIGIRGRLPGTIKQRLGFVTPDRAGLPALDRYAWLERDGEQHLAGYVEASRGCLHTCLHCPITPVYQGRFFVVPFEIVMADIRQQVAAGARHITFGDPDFLNGPRHAMRLARALHAEFPDVTFDATIKVEHILENRHLFPELADLGCTFVLSAVESLSDTVLTALRKGHTRADIEAALQVMDAAGIPLRMSLVAFTPWTTLDDYVNLLEWVAGRGLVGNIDPVQFTIRLLIPPGSALLSDGFGAPWLGDLDQDNFAWNWSHPDPRMDALHATVTSTVESMTAAAAPAVDVFEAVRNAGYRAAGLQAPALERTIALRSVPRLTENWFC